MGRFFRILFLSLTGKLDNMPTTLADWRIIEPHWNKKLSELQGFNTPHYQEWINARAKLAEEMVDLST